MREFVLADEAPGSFSGTRLVAFITSTPRLWSSGETSVWLELGRWRDAQWGKFRQRINWRSKTVRGGGGKEKDFMWGLIPSFCSDGAGGERSVEGRPLSTGRESNIYQHFQFDVICITVIVYLKNMQVQWKLIDLHAFIKPHGLKLSGMWRRIRLKIIPVVILVFPQKSS